MKLTIQMPSSRHTWIASVTWILHYCEATGLFNSNESFRRVATTPVSEAGRVRPEGSRYVAADPETEDRTGVDQKPAAQGWKG